MKRAGILDWVPAFDRIVLRYPVIVIAEIYLQKFFGSAKWDFAFTMPRQVEFMPEFNSDVFDLKDLLRRLRAAATRPDAAKVVRSILEQTFAASAQMATGMPEFKENDVILFEDDTVSIWFSRFMPGVTVPAHDHQMSAIIGVYQGAERNDLFENDPAGGIRKSGKVELFAGDVLSLGPNAIHTVTCISEEPCCGIHVYLGNLTKVERSLFDVEAAVTLPFTDEHYHRLMRPKHQ